MPVWLCKLTTCVSTVVKLKCNHRWKILWEWHLSISDMFFVHIAASSSGQVSTGAGEYQLWIVDLYVCIATCSLVLYVGCLHWTGKSTWTSVHLRSTDCDLYLSNKAMHTLTILTTACSSDFIAISTLTAWTIRCSVAGTIVQLMVNSQNSLQQHLGDFIHSYFNTAGMLL